MSVLIEVDETDLKNGVLGLVVALVEIIKETLELQALKRIEAGSLTTVESERLGVALLDLDAAIQKLKVELGVERSVRAVRDGLDRAIQDVLGSISAPSGLGAAELDRAAPAMRGGQ